MLSTPAAAGGADDDAGAAAWDDRPAVGDPNASEGDTSVKETIQKEATIRDVVELQTSLKSLVDTVNALTSETDKLKTDNEMLTTYIENLSRSAAMTVSGSGRASMQAGRR